MPCVSNGQKNQQDYDRWLRTTDHGRAAAKSWSAFMHYGVTRTLKNWNAETSSARTLVKSDPVGGIYRNSVVNDW